MPRKANQSTKSPNSKAKAGNRKGNKQVAPRKREDNPFNNAAIKRLSYVAGISIMSKQAADACRDYAEVIIQELVRLSACSAVFNKRKSLQKVDIEFASAALGLHVLASSADFKKLQTKPKIKREAGAEPSKIRIKNATKAKRSIKYFQSHSENRVVFASAPLRRRISEILRDNYEFFGLVTANEDGVVPKVKFSDEYKKLFQYTLEAVLYRILHDAYIICGTTPKVTVTSLAVRAAAHIHFHGLF